ncbi:MAG: Cdc6/Cdc18 family protein [Halapricum sp.]
MNIDDRIRQRYGHRQRRRLVHDEDAISPVEHRSEPVDRGEVLEQLLDHFDPVFDGHLPSDLYVHGPAGSGKSALLTVLFDALDRHLERAGTMIYTTTRAQSSKAPRFVYVDSRHADSRFRLYRSLLIGLIDESVPKQGIGTDELETRIKQHIVSQDRGIIVAIDHLDEPWSMDLTDVSTMLGRFDHSLSMVGISRTRPEDLDSDVDLRTVEVMNYNDQAIVDILMTRGSSGLARNAFRHSQARRIATWADGNAHDALAALFGAATLADTDDVEQIRDEDIDAGIDAVPRPGVSLGVVLSLPENRQRVLRELLAIDAADRESVTATTEAIADTPDIDLSAGTVKRFLYELAETGIVERVTTEATGQGRPPSRLKPRFPTLVFRRLYDLRTDRR